LAGRRWSGSIGTVCAAAGTVSAALFGRAAEQIIFGFFLCAFQHAPAAAGAGDFFQFFFADDDAKNQAAVFAFEMNGNNHKKTPRKRKAFRILINDYTMYACRMQAVHGGLGEKGKV
jgi:hypothetical protein